MAGESASDSARRMREKADRLARTADLWERGAEGERVTASVLEGLPSVEWTVFHDVKWPGRPRANIDHVVVGPAGVFVVDSKNWNGRIHLDGSVLRQNGRSREKVVHGAAEAALAVAGLTQAVPPQQVYPAICFTRDEPVTGWARDVMLCSTSNVVEMLTTRPRILDAATCRQLCLELDASFRAAIDAPSPRKTRSARAGSSPARLAPPPPVGGRVPTRRAPAGRRTNRRSGAGRAVGGLVGAVAAVAFLIGGGPGALGDFIVHSAAPGDPPAPVTADPHDNRSVAGTWVGSYTCGADKASAHLRFVRIRGSRTDLSGVFAFAPLAKGERGASGSYRVQGKLVDGVLTVTPGPWIEQPAGYVTVGFSANVSDERPTVLEGDGPVCNNFRFSRR